MAGRLNLDHHRWQIIWVWLIGMIINIGLVIWADASLYRTIDTPPDALREPINRLYGDLLTLYLPYLSTMLAIGFARRTSTVTIMDSPRAFGAAILISLLWNGFLIFRTTQLSVLHTLTLQDLTDGLQFFTKMAFLVTPVLAYYFSSEHP